MIYLKWLALMPASFIMALLVAFSRLSCLSS